MANWARFFSQYHARCVTQGYFLNMFCNTMLSNWYLLWFYYFFFFFLKNVIMYIICVTDFPVFCWDEFAPKCRILLAECSLPRVTNYALNSTDRIFPSLTELTLVMLLILTNQGLHLTRFMSSELIHFHNWFSRSRSYQLVVSTAWISQLNRFWLFG